MRKVPDQTTPADLTGNIGEIVADLRCRCAQRCGNFEVLIRCLLGVFEAEHEVTIVEIAGRRPPL